MSPRAVALSLCAFAALWACAAGKPAITERPPHPPFVSEVEGTARTPLLDAGPDGKRGTSPQPVGKLVRLEWVMDDLDPLDQEECLDDSRQKWIVDLRASTLTFFPCPNTKEHAVVRQLKPLELAAVLDIAKHFDDVGIACDRATALSYAHVTREDGSLFLSCRDESGWRRTADEWDANGSMDRLLSGIGRTKSRACGGPLNLQCPAKSDCMDRNGASKFAFGSCRPQPKPGGGTISCMAMYGCRKGWKQTFDCEPGMHCVYYSMCDRETLCAKCDPSEECPTPF